MKVWNYVFIAITSMLFFEFLGIPTALNGLLAYFSIGIENGILTGFNFTLSDFSAYLFAGLGDFFTSTEGFFSLLTGGTITAGLFYAGKPDIAIKAGLAGVVFLGFVSALFFPLTHALDLELAAWAIGIMAMIYIPFTIGFLFALIEYVVGGGTD